MNRAFALGIILNIIFVIVEVTYGLVADSLALLADAGHNLSDILTLLLAWGANVLAQKKPTARRTYGLRRATNLAALLSSILLLLAMGGIAWEALGRFADRVAVDGQTIIIVAAIGVVINGVTAWLFAAGSKHDLNVKAAFLHMAADAGVSLGVVLLAGSCVRFGTTRHRSATGSRLPVRTTRGRSHSRLAHLGHEHERNRADRTPRHAGRQRRR